MRIFKNPIFCVIFFLFSCSGSAHFGQTHEIGSWNILNVKYNHNQKWSVFSEGQIRSLKFYDHFHYYEYKGGVNYKPIKNIQLTLGVGSYQTYREGGDFVTPKNNNELRVWPQIMLNQTFGKFKIEQRYRAEMRFTSTGYRNRFRYRLGLLHSTGTLFGKPIQLGISNELFFTNKEPYFERNRLQLSTNYKLSEVVTFQLGYLSQFDYKINDEIGRDFLTVGIFFEFSAKGLTKK